LGREGFDPIFRLDRDFDEPAGGLARRLEPVPAELELNEAPERRSVPRVCCEDDLDTRARAVGIAEPLVEDRRQAGVSIEAGAFGGSSLQRHLLQLVDGFRPLAVANVKLGELQQDRRVRRQEAERALQHGKRGREISAPVGLQLGHAHPEGRDALSLCGFGRGLRKRAHDAIDFVRGDQQLLEPGRGKLVLGADLESALEQRCRGRAITRVGLNLGRSQHEARGVRAIEPDFDHARRGLLEQPGVAQPLGHACEAPRRGDVVGLTAEGAAVESEGRCVAARLEQLGQARSVLGGDARVLDTGELRVDLADQRGIARPERETLEGGERSRV